MSNNNVASMGMRFFASGVELVKQTHAELTESGKRMWAGIAAGAEKALPGMKAVNAASLEFNQGLQSMAANAGPVGRVLTATGAGGIALAAGLGAAIVALRQTRQAMAFGDEIADSAEKIRSTTDELQEFRYAIHAVGGETSDADAGLKGFIERLGEARSGLSSRALKPFEALGITKEDLARFKEAGDVLPLIADKIAALGSEADQSAIAKRLGLEPLLPLLRQGADAVERLRQEARDTGAVMDKDLVQRLGNSNDKFEQMSRLVDLQLKQSFVGLTPVLLDLMEHTARWLGMLNSVIDRFTTLQGKSTDGLKIEEQQWRQQIADLQSGKLPSRPFRNLETAQAGLTANLQEQWRRANPNTGGHKHLRPEEAAAAIRAVTGGNGTTLIDVDAEEKAKAAAEKRQREREREQEQIAARDQRFAAAMASLRDKAFAANAREADTIDERLKVELDRLAAASAAAVAERAEQVKREDLTQTQADLLNAEQQKVDEAQRAALTAKAQNDKQEAADRYAADLLALEREVLEHYADMAVTVRDREEAQRILLRADQEQARQALEERIRSDPNLSPADAQNLRDQQGRIEAAQDEALADRQNGLREAVYGAWHDAIGDLLQGDVSEMFRDFFGGLADHFASKLNDRMADALFDWTEKVLGELGGGSLGGVGDFLGDAIGWAFGGGRAAGGPAQPGYVFRAAEHDTEIAMIGRQGQVFNHQDTVDMLQDAVGARGDGVTVNTSFAPVYNVTGTGEDIERLRAQMKRDQEGFHSRVISAVNDGHRRGMISTGRA